MWGFSMLLSGKAKLPRIQCFGDDSSKCFPTSYYIVILYKYKASNESSLLLMNAFVCAPAHFMRNLSSYKDSHKRNALNKHLKVGMWMWRWKPGSRRVPGNRFHVAPYSCYKSKSEGTETVRVELKLWGLVPEKPFLPAECSQSSPGLQPSASGLYHKGWPPLSGICDAHSCHMLKEEATPWARATESTSTHPEHDLFWVQVCPTDNWQIPSTIFPAEGDTEDRY